MTDIEQLWRQDRDTDRIPDNLMSEQFIHRIPSRLPMARLRRNLLASIIAAILITLMYAWVLYFFHAWPVLLVLCILISFNGWAIITGWRLYKQLPISVIPSHSLKQELESHVSSFSRWWSQQVKISLFIYPVAAAAGFLIGGMVATGRPPEFFLTRPRILVLLLVAVLFLMPLCYWLDRRLYRHLYGRHLAALQAAISELS